MTQLSHLVLVGLCNLIGILSETVYLIDCVFKSFSGPYFGILYCYLLLQRFWWVLAHQFLCLIFQLLPEAVIEGPLNSVIRILLQSNCIEESMQVHTAAVDKFDVDEIAPQISCFIGIVEEVCIVQRLMDISNHMQEIPGHPSPLEGYAIPVVPQDIFTPVNGIDGVDILLEGGHTLEGVVRVVNSNIRWGVHIGEMIGIEHGCAV